MHACTTLPRKAKWSGPHQRRWEENESKFHSVTWYTNCIVSLIHVNTTKLRNITCTLVATCVILRSLECSICAMNPLQESSLPCLRCVLPWWVSWVFGRTFDHNYSTLVCSWRVDLTSMIVLPIDAYGEWRQAYFTHFMGKVVYNVIYITHEVVVNHQNQRQLSAFHSHLSWANPCSGCGWWWGQSSKS